jgi:DNA-binding MarR family transcriptional regulator
LREDIDAMPEPAEAAQDQVDEVIERWARERPGLDVRPMAVMTRVIRLNQQREQLWQELYAKFGVKQGECDVLAALRSSGPPYQLSPTVLFRTLCLSSGAMTARLDRLEEQGLVERRPDPQDRRGTVVALTEAGRELEDRAMPELMRRGEQLLSGLSAEELDELAALLRKLLLSLGQAAP